MSASEVTPFPARLRNLAEKKGLSVERVLAEAWDPDVPGTSPNTVKKVIAGTRPLQPVQIEAISAVLGVDPSVFLEYRLAKLRESFDERVVSGGLEEAWAHYREFVSALQIAATMSATELERTANTAPPMPATAGEVRSLLEARTRSRG